MTEVAGSRLEILVAKYKKFQVGFHALKVAVASQRMCGAVDAVSFNPFTSVNNHFDEPYLRTFPPSEESGILRADDADYM